MRIPINLSSEPFRHDRPVLLASGICAVVLGGLLGVMIFLVTTNRGQAGNTRGQVDRLTTQLRTMAAEQAQLDATLRQPANAFVLERSALLNTLVERKAISWTKIFADLEGVLPYNVRIIQVRLPQINSQNQVLLDMVVGAQSPDPVITFLKQLQASPLFGPATVHSSLPPTQNDPLYKYRVSVDYAQKL